MDIVYKIVIYETEKEIFGFTITRTRTIEPGITIEEPFSGNWSHDRFKTRTAAIREAKERIERNRNNE